MTRSALALLLAIFVVGGCGPRDGGTASGPRDGDVGVSDPEQPVTSTPSPGGPAGDGGPKRVQPRPGMADLREVSWEKARPVRDGKALRVTYWSGVEPCNVLDHVDVRYAKSTITVTLYEGHDPEAEDVACIEIALQKVVRVPLEEPVGDRKIVDGSKR